MNEYEFKFDIKELNNLFFITEFKSSSDDYIAEICGVTLNDFKNIMCKEYNAILYNQIKNSKELVYFKTYEETEKALEWVKSMILMRKLAASGD